MFTKEVLDENRTKEEERQKKCSAMLGGKELKVTNSSGIELKPVYTPEDIKKGGVTLRQPVKKLLLHPHH